jgi:hypothetical protein
MLVAMPDEFFSLMPDPQSVEFDMLDCTCAYEPAVRAHGGPFERGLTHSGTSAIVAAHSWGELFQHPSS